MKSADFKTPNKLVAKSLIFALLLSKLLSGSQNLRFLLSLRFLCISSKTFLSRHLAQACFRRSYAACCSAAPRDGTR